MEKLYASKTFLKMAGGRMHIPHPTPLDSPLTISYRTIKRIWHISVTFGTISIVLFTKRQSQKGGVWHNGPLLNSPLRAKFRQ